METINRVRVLVVATVIIWLSGSNKSTGLSSCRGCCDTRHHLDDDDLVAGTDATASASMVRHARRPGDAGSEEDPGCRSCCRYSPQTSGMLSGRGWRASWRRTVSPCHSRTCCQSRSGPTGLQGNHRDLDRQGEAGDAGISQGHM